MNTTDDFANSLCNGTAEKFQILAALRGVSSQIEWRGEEGNYYANGVKCGPSVHGLYEWLKNQPSVKP